MVEDLAAGRFDERALFHLLNLAREERAFVLLTARTSPAGWLLSVPDLASRLRALPVVTLSAPDDVLLRGVIVKLPRPPARCRREPGRLPRQADRALLRRSARRGERLDQEAMRQQRPVTRALAAELFR